MDDFTLLVPVRDRVYNIKNICSYYKDLDCRKLIVDSSKVEFDDIDLIQSCGFEYIYYGPTTYIEKMNRIYKEIITTEFVLDCADDDIVLKNSIKECVEFLRKNKDYSCCDGGTLKLVKPSNHLKMYRFNSFMGRLKENFSSPIIKERLSFEFNCWQTKQHAVLRTQAASRVWDFLQSNPPLHPLSLIEVIHCFVISMMGNVKSLSSVCNIRNDHNPQQFFNHGECREISLPDGFERDDRLIHRVDIKDEFQSEVKISSILEDERLKLLVDLLLEDDSTSTELETYNFVKKLLGDFIVAAPDQCHIDCDNWEGRAKTIMQLTAINDQVAEAINFMQL